MNNIDWHAAQHSACRFIRKTYGHGSLFLLLPCNSDIVDEDGIACGECICRLEQVDIFA